MHRRQTLAEIERQVGSVSRLDRKTLAEQWYKSFGRPAPKGVSRRLLERACAYGLQAKALGGLEPAVIRRLSRFASFVDSKRSSRKSSTPLSPGGRLVREWNGRVHTVEVSPDGYVWNGRTYRSLSSVASAITGSKWSGPRFFGL